MIKIKRHIKIYIVAIVGITGLIVVPYLKGFNTLSHTNALQQNPFFSNLNIEIIDIVTIHPGKEVVAYKTSDGKIYGIAKIYNKFQLLYKVGIGENYYGYEVTEDVPFLRLGIAEKEGRGALVKFNDPEIKYIIMGGNEDILVYHLNKTYSELLEILDYHDENYVFLEVSNEYIFAYKEFHRTEDILYYSNVMAFGKNGNLRAYQLSNEVKYID